MIDSLTDGLTSCRLQSDLDATLHKWKTMQGLMLKPPENNAHLKRDQQQVRQTVFGLDEEHCNLQQHVSSIEKVLEAQNSFLDASELQSSAGGCDDADISVPSIGMAPSIEGGYPQARDGRLRYGVDEVVFKIEEERASPPTSFNPPTLASPFKLTREEPEQIDECVGGFSDLDEEIEQYTIVRRSMSFDLMDHPSTTSLGPSGNRGKGPMPFSTRRETVGAS
jgi:hypothetical protein